jgi:hypothetical protein
MAGRVVRSRIGPDIRRDAVVCLSTLRQASTQGARVKGKDQIKKCQSQNMPCGSCRPRGKCSAGRHFYRHCRGRGTPSLVWLLSDENQSTPKATGDPGFRVGVADDAGN